MEIQREDVSKLHSEVNQLMNQRYLLTTSAITIFGVFSSFMFPKISTKAEDLIISCNIIVAGTVFILLFYLLLYYWYRKLLLLHWTIVIYLQKKKLSQWEKDINIFIKKYPHAVGMQNIVFLLLGFFSTLWAFVIFYCLKLPVKNERSLILLTAFLIYICLIYLIYLRSRRFKKINETWDEVLEMK